MAIKNYHRVLVRASSYDAACRHAIDFFKKTQLVNYDSVEILDDRSHGAAAPKFWPSLEKALADNRLTLDALFDELKESGINSVDDLGNVKQGGDQSKLLLIIAHQLNGFIGIDSAFYNLSEDSHQLSDEMKQAIVSDPTRYWLLLLDVSFESVGVASLVHF